MIMAAIFIFFPPAVSLGRMFGMFADYDFGSINKPSLKNSAFSSFFSSCPYHFDLMLLPVLCVTKVPNV